MKFAYPQNKSGALDAVRRYDESSDSATSQSNLERQQDIAVVGETVPMVFCHRHDWGGGLGQNGGVWISPRLIQLGIKQFDLNMMYLLSQGQIKNLKTDNTYWGYQKLKDVDSGAQMCYAYEAVPACLNLDYDPGGSLSWTETVNRTGPSVSTGSINYTSSTDRTIKMSFRFSSSITSRYSGSIVCGGDWTHRESMTCVERTPGSSCGYSGGYSCSSASSGNSKRLNELRGKGLSVSQYQSPKERPACSGIDTYRTYYWEASTSNISRNATIYYNSGIYYYYEVRNAADYSLAKSGYVWIDNGNTSLTIDGLAPAKYTVQFTVRSYGWRSGQPCLVSPNENMQSQVNYYNGRNMGFSRSAYGSGSASGNSVVTETIYNRLDFPDLPGGDQQIVGGLQDLTMLGIKGNINELRPTDGTGPDYFVQSHIFIESGIEVTRLTWGGVGPSPFYGDLVNHLMNTTKVLKNDQINVDSFKVVNRMNAVYDMYFNGVLQTTTSLSEWMTQTAPYFLATPRQIDGKYGLWPVCPLNSANELSRDRTVPVLTVTRDDIIEGSYSRSYISVRDRRPVCLVMVYRDQPAQSVGQTVTVEVRYPGSALSGPFESHDLTEFCCRSEQAVYAARYILAKRRYTTHSVSFTMARRAAQLKPGDIIKVDLALDTTDGAGITDAIFYQIESLSEGQGGSVSIEALHFPVTGNDVSVVAYETHEGRVSIT